MLYWISLVSLLMSIASFLLFVASIVSSTLTGGPNAVRKEAPLEELSKATEALSKLVDSLNRARPSTVALVASIVFILISLLAAKT